MGAILFLICRYSKLFLSHIKLKGANSQYPIIYESCIDSTRGIVCDLSRIGQRISARNCGDLSCLGVLCPATLKMRTVAIYVKSKVYLLNIFPVLIPMCIGHFFKNSGFFPRFRNLYMSLFLFYRPKDNKQQAIRKKVYFHNAALNSNIPSLLLPYGLSII